MLYVIMERSWDDFDSDSLTPKDIRRLGSKDYIKIGYTRNKKSLLKRLSSYSTHTPKYVLYKTFDGGTYEDEQNFHLYLKKYKCSTFRGNREWFYFTDDVEAVLDSVNTIEEVRHLVSTCYMIDRKTKLSISDKSVYSSLILSIISDKDDSAIVKLDRLNNIRSSLENILLCNLISFVEETYGIKDIISLNLNRQTIEYEKYGEEIKHRIDSFLDNFYSTKITRDQLKIYCSFRDSLKGNPLESEIVEVIDQKVGDIRYSMFYAAYGTAGCKARKYRFNEIEDLIKIDLSQDKVKAKVIDTFKLNGVYTLADIKLKFSTIYSDLGLKKTAKATDINAYFVTRATNKTDENNKVIHCLRMLDYIN